LPLVAACAILTAMPLFEYRCRDCDHRFEALVQGSRRPACPSCEGRRLEKQLSAFAVGAPSAAASPMPSGCGTCGDPRGPGACKLDG
jgi:putative FmdB family regulatory protein